MNTDEQKTPETYPYDRHSHSRWRRVPYVLDASDVAEAALEVGCFVEDALTKDVERERWIEAAHLLAGYCLNRAGVACAKCRGQGEMDYRHSSGWRGGAGVPVSTYDVCDVCWGTGRTDLVGEDLRAARDRAKETI